MNEEINPSEALKKVEEYLKKTDELLKKTYKTGTDEKEELVTLVQGFIRATFRDDEKKLNDFKKTVPLYIAISRREDTEEEKQSYYISHLKRIKNHLVSFKEELNLIISSEKDSKVINELEKQINDLELEAKRRSAVAEEKRWGAMIELIQMQRDELKKRGFLSQEIIDIKKDISEIKTIVTELKEAIG